MKSRKLARGLLVCGVILFFSGVLWPFLFPQGIVWDDAQAKELTTASETLHETMHAHNRAHDNASFGETKADDDPEVVAAAERYRTAQAGLAKATFWANTAPVYLRWSGLALCIGGVAAFAASRNE